MTARMTVRTTAMMKLMAPLLLLAGLAGAAVAQTAAPAPGAAAPAALPAPGAGAAAPAALPAPAAGAAAAASPDPSQTAPTAAPAGDARKQCAAAMNGDPQFAAEIIKIADEKAAAQRDVDTLAAHTNAVAHVQRNERHVIYAYAAMWLVAAAFVVFLWRRQQSLNAEIAQLRRDLEAATEDAKQTELRR